MDHYELKLSKPIEIGAEKRTTLRMRTVPTVGDWRKASKHSKSQEEQSAVMVELLCGLLPGELDGLSMKDFAKLSAKVDLEIDEIEPGKD